MLNDGKGKSDFVRSKRILRNRYIYTLVFLVDGAVSAAATTKSTFSSLKACKKWWMC